MLTWEDARFYAYLATSLNFLSKHLGLTSKTFYIQTIQSFDLARLILISLSKKKVFFYYYPETHQC